MLRRALQTLRRWLFAPSEPEGSGSSIPEPAYNEQWEADRELRRIETEAHELSERSSEHPE